MNDLNDILTWKQNFGLLPIHLFPLNMNEQSFIMLNGGVGDFCLKMGSKDQDKEEYHSLSWSSNTKNFVVLNSTDIEIFNWKKSKTEVIDRLQVEENFEKFYKYLASNSYKTERDLVPFVINIFKKFRNITQEKNNAVEALNLLFLLLASLEDNVGTIDFKKWGLEESQIPSDFDLYVKSFQDGFSGLTPKLDVIIRHSSGTLFQEAQKEALFFDRQLDIWEGASTSLTVKRNLYSSIHYTPPYLARTIVENSIRELDINKANLKIFDPACGSSEFLLETLKQLNEKGFKGSVEIIGFDSSETAINTSLFLLNYEKRTLWSNRVTITLRLVEDSLQESWDNDYDLILMNPPFVSWEQLGMKSRSVLKDVLAINGIGKPNQASAFFYKALQSLSSTGIIGCIIPSSLLTLDSYQSLRMEALEMLDIKLIGKLGNFIFEDALTDVSAIVAVTSRTKDTPYVLWTKNEKGVAQSALRDLRKMHYSNSNLIVQKDYSIYKPSSFPIAKENWKLISYKESELFKTIERFVLENKLTRIETIFNVQQGIRTGKNEVFKISSSTFEKLPDGEKFYFRPVIDNEAIKKGEILPKNYVWYPYNLAGLIIKSEADLENVAPITYNSILLPAKSSLLLRARKDESTWWTLSEHRAWLRKNEPRLVSTEFGESDSFAFDKDGIFAVERGNAWLPKKEFKSIDYYYFYLSIFSSPFFNKLLSIYSKQLAGGNWYDLGKKYTGKIPIPDIHSNDVQNSDGFVKLVEIGKRLSSDENFYLKVVIDDVLLKYFYPQI